MHARELLPSIPSRKSVGWYRGRKGHINSGGKTVHDPLVLNRADTRGNTKKKHSL